MKKAAVGFRVHSGWCAAVVVTVERGELLVLRRERVRLVKTFSYTFRQPYHTAERMEFEEAGEFVARVRAEAEDLAYGWLHATQMELKKLQWNLQRGALLLASGRALPEFAKILLAAIRERELLERSAKAFSMKSATLLRRATDIGREFGAPWTQDEKFATLAAWLALG
jgi:hypothetical protein